MTTDISPDSRLEPHTRKIAAALIVGATLPLLDATIVNVAIHPLATDLGADVETTHWVITGYALASALAIILTGWATRRFGATAVWRTAVVGFALASGLCAVAWNVETLIGFRALQGFAAGLSMPVMQTLLIGAAGKTQAMRAMAAVGTPAIVAPVLGPLVGGLLLDTSGWRSIFLINVPIGLLALVLAVRLLPRPSPENPRARFDLAGFALFAPGLVLSVYGLASSETSSSFEVAVACLVTALMLFGAYAVRARRRDAPLVDVTLFRLWSFTSAWTSLTLSSAVFYGGLFLLPLYYQTVHGVSPLQTGALLALLGAGAFLGRTLSNRLVDRWGTCATAYVFVVCTLLGTLPFALPAFANTSWSLVEAVALIVRGMGIGALTLLTMSAIYHRLPAEMTVHASTWGRIATQFGSALGIAACTVVLSASGSIGPVTFGYLSVFTAALAVTAMGLPRGRIVRE